MLQIFAFFLYYPNEMQKKKDSRVFFAETLIDDQLPNILY